MKKNLFTLGGFVGSKNQVLARVTKPLVKDHWDNLRFHIDDTTAVINNKDFHETIKYVYEAQVVTEEGVPFKLSEILQGWEGYKYYDGLKNIEVLVIYAPSIRYPAFYVKKYDTIYINTPKLIEQYESQTTNTGMGSKTPNDRKTKRTVAGSPGQPGVNLWQYTASLLFHELQHAIQRRERINMPPTTDEYILERSQLKYQKGDLSTEQFKKWLCGKHNTTSLREAIDIEYKDLPTEKECIAVEQELLKHYEERGFMKDGGVISSLNKKYSFKDLFKKP